MWRNILFATAIALVAVSHSAGTPTDSDTNGEGWTMTRLDLDVAIDRDAKTMQISGSLSLRLDSEKSFGPTLGINANHTSMKWVSLETGDGAEVELNATVTGHPVSAFAHVRFGELRTRGEVVDFQFRTEYVEGAPQLLVREDVAFASWVEGWYPAAIPRLSEGETFTPRLISVPGTTTLRMPSDWIAISDGELVRREKSEEMTVEEWRLDDAPVARGFAAGPYKDAEKTTENGTIRIYLLEEHPITVDRLAGLLASTMDVQSARLGAFPFDGYGVVEVPDDIEGWYAASQQTFIMARSSAFEYEHGNLPLWAHEMGHAWWGNTVGSSGPGSKMVGEALAQLGVLIALESIEGRDAMIEFLEESRTGYSSMQCAKGYFKLVDQGKDHPLATLDTPSVDQGTAHTLSDSKGMWFYHMLRMQVGDEVFFATLRSLIDRYSGSRMTLDDLRSAFADASPDKKLEEFFAQWLDRDGAPHFDVEWSERGERTDIMFAQQEGADPFNLNVAVELELSDGTIRRESVDIHSRATIIGVELPSKLSRVTIDPDRDFLIWRDAYGAGPTIDGVALTAEASWLELETYVGEYVFGEQGPTIQVYEKDGAVWVDIGDHSDRLWPWEETPHRFRGSQGWVTFEVKDGRAESARYERDGGAPTMATRVN